MNNNKKYTKIGDTVVSTYKKVENTVVNKYNDIEDHFVGKYFSHEGETVQQAKERLKARHPEHKAHATTTQYQNHYKKEKEYI